MGVRTRARRSHFAPDFGITCLCFFYLPSAELAAVVALTVIVARRMRLALVDRRHGRGA